MFEDHYPLVDRALDERIAYLSSSIEGLGLEAGVVSVETFIQHACAIAEQLPDADYAINLCENRYLFMLGFCAALVKGQTNLLPPNKTVHTQRTMQERYPSSYVLHDGIDITPDSSAFHLVDNASLAAPPSVYTTIPLIPLDFLAAITFTSGSTGASKPNNKSWRTFVESTAINARYMLPGDDHVWQLATVPGQHMWGMETSILLPLMKSVCVCDARPLYPMDIAQALQALPSPRMLVSTPVHLRALTLSGIDFPRVARILCATAPLAPEMAAEVERTFSGQLQEIYGCSEVGSMAYRRTAETQIWNAFDGIDFTSENDMFSVSAEHLPESTLLQDRLERISESQFRLVGRSDDMIEIAGKRGSLAELNKVLNAIPGVVDGAVFQVENFGKVGRLAALVVLADGMDVSMISHKFRDCLDAVFVPRSIYPVHCLPREDNGKLMKSRLLALYETVKQAK